MLIHPEVMGVEALADKIRKIENWPQKGILFHDITPVLQSAEYFRLLVDLLVYRYMGQKVDVVAGLDARGFIIGAALAYQLNVGFVPIRKKGKLPFDTVSQSYALEYGEATVEIHTDAIKPGARVLLVDDLVATGGTMLAGVELIRKLGGEVIEAAAILEFTDLDGGKKSVKARAVIYPVPKQRLHVIRNRKLISLRFFYNQKLFENVSVRIPESFFHQLVVFINQLGFLRTIIIPIQNDAATFTVANTQFRHDAAIFIPTDDLRRFVIAHHHFGFRAAV